MTKPRDPTPTHNCPSKLAAGYSSQWFERTGWAIELSCCSIVEQMVYCPWCGVTLPTKEEIAKEVCTCTDARDKHMEWKRRCIVKDCKCRLFEVIINK
jgi:hypothetical protein